LSNEHSQFIHNLQVALHRIAETVNRTFQSILLLYMQERLLFRLSKSRYRENFVLKGGLLVHSLTQFKGRPTKDIDLLVQQVTSDLSEIESIFREICQISVEDGIIFDSENLTSEPQNIDNNAVIRLKITGFLGKMKVLLRIDLSFQGIICPAPVDIMYPVLLEDQESPRLKAYSSESSIAEKFHAMIFLSELNTRMKDFYDIYSFASIYSFNGQILLNAVRETFHQRNTSVEKDHVIFTPEFAHYSERVKQWNVFLLRIGGESIGFDVVMERITVFLKPIYDCFYNEVDFSLKWNPLTSDWES